MGIQRVSEQTRATLTGFYEEAAASEDDTTRSIGKAMLALLRGLEARFPTRQIWGLTSHYRLWLLAADDSTAPWLVSVIGHHREYVVEYRMPAAAAPWPEALVRGTAISVEQTLDMVDIGMTRSGGWR